MATLTLNASITPSRQITVTAGTGGSLSGTVALLIDNTAGKFDTDKLVDALIRAYRRRASKASKVSGIATSGTSKE